MYRVILWFLPSGLLVREPHTEERELPTRMSSESSLTEISGDLNSSPVPITESHTGLNRRLELPCA